MENNKSQNAAGEQLDVQLPLEVLNLMKDAESLGLCIRVNGKHIQLGEVTHNYRGEVFKLITQSKESQHGDILYTPVRKSLDGRLAKKLLAEKREAERQEATRQNFNYDDVALVAEINFVPMMQVILDDEELFEVIEKDGVFFRQDDVEFSCPLRAGEHVTLLSKERVIEILEGSSCSQIESELMEVFLDRVAEKCGFGSGYALPTFMLEGKTFDDPHHRITGTYDFKGVFSGKE